MIEERSPGVIDFTQPGGHIETGESPEEAVIREVLEQAGSEVVVSGFLGVYLWIHPQTRQQFLRLVYTARIIKENVNCKLNDSVHGVHWYSLADIAHRKRDLKTPIVLRCIEDYVAGKFQPENTLAGMAPIEQNVAAVMANAHLV